MTKEELLNRLEHEVNFAKEIGIKITTAEKGYSEGEIEINESHLNPGGTVHGGCIFSLADTIGGTAAYSFGKPCVTLNAQMDYLRAAKDCKKIIAKANCVRQGRKTAVYDICVYDDKDVLVAKSSMTFYLFDE